MQKKRKNRWKMFLPEIWWLVDPKGKVLAKVFHPAFKRTRKWTVWMPAIPESQRHNTLGEAAIGAEKAWA
jgi:hypothetical protein